jgi:hypothetical protein
MIQMKINKIKTALSRRDSTAPLNCSGLNMMAIIVKKY